MSKYRKQTTKSQQRSFTNLEALTLIGRITCALSAVIERILSSAWHTVFFKFFPVQFKLYVLHVLSMEHFLFFVELNLKTNIRIIQRPFFNNT